VSGKRKVGAPSFASFAKGGNHKRLSASVDLDVAFDVERVERTLLSVAFDLDLARTLIKRGCPIFRVLCERWEPQTPAAPVLTLTLLLTLNVWNRHSCPLPFDAVVAFEVRKIRIRVCLQAYRKPTPHSSRKAAAECSPQPALSLPKGRKPWVSRKRKIEPRQGRQINRSRGTGTPVRGGRRNPSSMSVIAIYRQLSESNLRCGLT